MPPARNRSLPGAAAGCRGALPHDAEALVADADAVLVDNRFPEFAGAVCRAAKARGLPIVIDLDQATRPDDALLQLGSHVVASAEALRGTTGETDFGEGLAVLAEHLTGFLAVTDGEHGVFWREGGALRHMPGFTGGGRRHAGRGRRLPRRLHAAPWRKARSSRARCASAAPPPRSNAPTSAAAAGAPRRAEVDRFLRRQDS